MRMVWVVFNVKLPTRMEWNQIGMTPTLMNMFSIPVQCVSVLAISYSSIITLKSLLLRHRDRGEKIQSSEYSTIYTLYDFTHMITTHTEKIYAQMGNININNTLCMGVIDLLRGRPTWFQNHTQRKSYVWLSYPLFSEFLPGSMVRNYIIPPKTIRMIIIVLLSLLPTEYKCANKIVPSKTIRPKS